MGTPDEAAEATWAYSAGAGLAQPSYLYADHQGSIVAVGNANGQTIQPNRYDEYGIPAVGNVGRFQYTGQIWLPELGMYHYKARIYSPPLGRFLQTDPVGYDDQFNLYAYVGNDPVNQTDPTGMCSTGSRLGESAQCRVLEGYAVQQQGAQQGRSTFGIRDRNSPQGRLVGQMMRDPEVRAAVNEAWRRARGDQGPTDRKNEYGFWVRRVGNDFTPGGLVRGEGPFIYRADIDRAHRDMPQARIFVHVHSFRIGERRGIESVGISNLDRRLAISLRSLIVSVGRPEPYTGRNVYIDWTDYYWGGPR